MGRIMYVVDFIKENGISEETVVWWSRLDLWSLVLQFHLYTYKSASKGCPVRRTDL